jgi:hypothetical protein
MRWSSTSIVACRPARNHLYNQITRPEIMGAILWHRGKIKAIHGRCSKVNNRALSV